MRIGVPLEAAPGETRVAMTPETAKKLVAQGHGVFVQSGAGLNASATDAAYEAVGCEITDQAGAFGCDLVLKVRSPLDSELQLMRTGANLVGMLKPFGRGSLHRLAGAGLDELRFGGRPAHDACAEHGRAEFASQHRGGHRVSTPTQV
jgi:NAD(P) transhydrogenase subunit alpha